MPRVVLAMKYDKRLALAVPARLAELIYEEATRRQMSMNRFLNWCIIQGLAQGGEAGQENQNTQLTNENSILTRDADIAANRARLLLECPDIDPELLDMLETIQGVTVGKASEEASEEADENNQPAPGPLPSFLTPGNPRYDEKRARYWSTGEDWVWSPLGYWQVIERGTLFYVDDDGKDTDG